MKKACGVIGRPDTAGEEPAKHLPAFAGTLACGRTVHGAATSSAPGSGPDPLRRREPGLASPPRHAGEVQEAMSSVRDFLSWRPRGQHEVSIFSVGGKWKPFQKPFLLGMYLSSAPSDL